MRSSRLPRPIQRRIPSLRVVITGSSRGIGREIARILLSNGGTVILNGRSQERLAAVEEELQREFPSATISSCVANVGTLEGADKLTDHVTQHVGGLDLLINNAGLSMRGPIADLSKETVDAMLTGNIATAVYSTRALIPLLIRSRGHVTFVSTVGAIHGFPGISMYSAAKGALPRFAEAVNAEYRVRGVTAGVVYLGFVENDPDKEIYSANGRRFHHNRRASQTQRDAATKIITASLRRRERSITIYLGRLLDVAHRIVPRVVTRVLSRSGGALHTIKEERPPQE